MIDFARTAQGSGVIHLRDGYRRIAYTGMDLGLFALSPASVYRILSKEGLLNARSSAGGSKGKGFTQPSAVHQHWHTDIKYINFKGTFLFFMSVIDGFSRYIVHHEIRTTMSTDDVQLLLQRAREKYPNASPRLITDNGKQYTALEFARFLQQVSIQHTTISPGYPQANGKIERFHRTLSEECLQRTGMLGFEDVQQQIARYIDHYNNHRLHSSLHYLRPVDFFEGKQNSLLKERQVKLDKAAQKRRQFWQKTELKAEAA